jgi:hypothetical protein
MAVVLSGHGEFKTATNPPSVRVPDGAAIYFYTENMKLLRDTYGGEIESMSALFQQASPSQVIYAGQPCPNYTLSPPDGLDVQDSPDDVDHYTVSADTTLGELIAGGVINGEVYWAACRAIDLKAAGGELLGVNAGQNDFGDEGGAVDTVPVDSSGQVGTADGWIAQFWTLDEAGQMQAFNDLPSGYKRLYSDYSPDLATWARQHEFIV